MIKKLADTIYVVKEKGAVPTKDEIYVAKTEDESAK